MPRGLPFRKEVGRWSGHSGSSSVAGFRTSKMSKLSTTLLLTSFTEKIIIIMNLSTQQKLLMQPFS